MRENKASKAEKTLGREREEKIITIMEIHVKQFISMGKNLQEILNVNEQ